MSSERANLVAREGAGWSRGRVGGRGSGVPRMHHMLQLFFFSISA